MTLIYIFVAILAVSAAETSDQKVYDDLVAMETMELKKESQDLTPAASAYNYLTPSQKPPQWQNYVPNQNYVSNQNYVPSPSYVPSSSWPAPNDPAKPSYPSPAPSVTPSPPYVPPVQSDYVPPQQNYYPQNTWSTPHYHVTTPSTPVAVIKNEHVIGPNGSYRYEYQIADGTHVGEEGYYTDPNQSDESLVKKGWYSYKGGDGKVYTVTYWADHTGYHASGAHLPTQVGVNKEEPGKQPVTFPPSSTTQKPYYPPQQTYYPPQQTYYPPQQTYYPQQQPGYGK